MRPGPASGLPQSDSGRASSSRRRAAPRPSEKRFPNSMAQPSRPTTGGALLRRGGLVRSCRFPRAIPRRCAGSCRVWWAAPAFPHAACPAPRSSALEGEQIRLGCLSAVCPRRFFLFRDCNRYRQLYNTKADDARTLTFLRRPDHRIYRRDHMAIDDASTALAPAATLSDPPVSTGAKRFPHGLPAGLAHCIDGGDAGDRGSRRGPARAAWPLPAVMARGTPGTAACHARPSGPPDAITAASHP